MTKVHSQFEQAHQNTVWMYRIDHPTNVDAWYGNVRTPFAVHAPARSGQRLDSPGRQADPRHAPVPSAAAITATNPVEDHKGLQ